MHSRRYSDSRQAEKNLQEAWESCWARSQQNRSSVQALHGLCRQVANAPSLILTYLIPCRLITQHRIPSAALLAAAPRLERIFGPLVSCIKRGDLTGFDKALAEGEPEFVRRRIFLTLERSRDIALRNLLRKVYLAGGFDDLKEGQTEKVRIRKSRIPLAHFATALRMGMTGEGSGQAVEDDEVECLMANQIYKVGLRLSVASIKEADHTRRSRCLSCAILGKWSPCPGRAVCLGSLATYSALLQYIWLTWLAGTYERLYFARARYGGPEQKGCLPRNWSLIP